MKIYLNKHFLFLNISQKLVSGQKYFCLPMTNYYLTHSICDRYVRGVANFLGSVSSQQKFEATDVKALGMSQLSDRPCYSSRTDQCYSSVLQFSFI